MRRLTDMLLWDLRLQLRHHIFTANVVSTLFICAFIKLLPFALLPPKVASFFVLSDPALIGLSFVGAMVLMEKASKVHMALSVTPSPPWVYVTSKIITLAVGGTLSGFAVAWAARGWTFDIGGLTLALLLANIFAVAFGFVLVAYSRSMNDLMIKLLIGTTALFLPLLGHFELVPPAVSLAFWLVPSMAMLHLFDGAFTAQGIAASPLASGYLVLCTVAACALGLRAYRNTMTAESD